MSLISVIIPFLNEEESMANLIKGLLELESTIERDKNLVEYVLVDDGSSDASILVLKKQLLPKNLRVIKLSQNFGSHAALRAGILHATGDYFCFLYADLQDPVDLIPKMYQEALSKNINLVWAHRKNSTETFINKRFSKFYSSIMRKYVNKNYPSKGFDIVFFDKKIQQQLNNNIESNSSIFLQILNLGFSYSNIEYEKNNRKVGKSKWTVSKKIKLLLDSFLGFSYAPIRFVSIVGILLFFIGILFSGYLIFRKLMLNDLASGWPMLISILLIGFGITNISLGIIAEYLWRTLDASRKRPVFIIDEIIEINEQ